VERTAQLSDRDRYILAALVRTYIERGEPVSSLWLARTGRLGLSSATVRNVFARLEEGGFVRQPHTSAGRVPTDLGYRCYVDMLLQDRRRARSSRTVEARLREAGTVDDVLSNVSYELFRLSHHVAFAMAPINEAGTLQQIDFVSLGGSKVLVVVIASGGQISHKVVDAGEQLRPDDLWQAASYLNSEFGGHSLAEIREAVLRQLQENRTLYDALMARALRLASSSLEEIAPRNTVFVQGASSLLADQSEHDGRLPMSTLRTLFRIIEEKHRLVRLLSEYIDGPGLTVVIGR
jgi:heat-inducible transcriptional repressor